MGKLGWVGAFALLFGIGFHQVTFAQDRTRVAELCAEGDQACRQAAEAAAAGLGRAEGGSGRDQTLIINRPDTRATDQGAARSGRDAPSTQEQKTGETLVPPVVRRTQAEASGQSQFQEFIAATVGRELPIFGQDLFRGVPSTFAPVDRVPVPSDYVIGPGDEILIRGWGQIDVDLRAVVDRDGTISIPKVGVVNVAGVRNQDLAPFLKNAIGRYFRNFDLSVSLGQLRSIQVFVVGQAQRPGSYTVSSLSTLVNALFASGGPAAGGSMRRIQLKRGAAVATEFDLYDLLVRGDKSKDRQLLPGDVIYIPPVGPLAAVAGSVNSPAIFELRPRSTLGELLDYSGGLTTTASGQTVMVQRIEARKNLQVAELALDAAGLAREIKDGDLVTVLPLTPRFDNAVTLRGSVATPGRYPWTQGMRVSDLIPNRESLIVPEYWTRVNAAPRVNRLGDQRLLASVKRMLPEPNWEYAVIERLDPGDLSTHLITFNLGKAVLKRDPDQNLALEAGDIVTVFSQEDIQVPVASRTSFVRLEGEVGAPGVYRVRPGETLRQVVERAGGLTGNAYLFGSEFTRESARISQQKRLSEYLDRLEQDAERYSGNLPQVLSGSDLQSAQAQIERQRRLIERLRRTKATGRIVLEIPPGRNQATDLPDLVLEDGDRFVVPDKPSTVAVVGSVYTPNSLIYRPEKRLGDYLAQTGGPTGDADGSSLYVLRADGSVTSKRQTYWLGGGFGYETVMPGDTIVVPEDLDKYAFTRQAKDWAQIFYQLFLGVAGLAAIDDLIN